MDARKDVDQAASLKCRECALRGVCLPASLLDPDLRQLEEIIRHNRRVARHKYLTRSSDPANQVYALRSGTLKTYLTGNDGRELVTGFVFPGELVGLDAFAGGQSASHVMALEPSLVCDSGWGAGGSADDERQAAYPAVQVHQPRTADRTGPSAP